MKPDLPLPDDVLLIADIEGSSGCRDPRGSRFMTRQWRRACVGMSRDVGAVVRALFDAGAATVRVKDFHRTGYNLLPHLIDRRAVIDQGYTAGPVPGIGRVAGTDAVMFVGMHAASGTPGFLAHTMTSRIADLRVNGKVFSEVELFSAALAAFGVRPLFFSGCPVACTQACEAISGMHTYPIDKSGGGRDVDRRSWREGLARAAAAALHQSRAQPHRMQGPFIVEVTMRDGALAAARVASRWGLANDGARITLEASDVAALFIGLVRLCYLRPATERFLGAGLFIYNLIGRAAWLTVRCGWRSRAED